MRWIGSLLLALVPAGIAAAAEIAGPVLETGVRDGAAYRIDVPVNWNHALVVYFHGFSPDPVPLPRDEPLAPQLQALVARGYAVAQSAYSATGWAIEQAGGDSERLRRYFIEKHAKPRETFALGMSMGGALTAMALEQAPDTYAGGLALCGVLEPTDHISQRAFAFRAAFDYYFPGMLGPLVPIADFRGDDRLEQRVAAALREHPQAARSLQKLSGIGVVSPGALLTAMLILRDLQQRAHGNPFSNADLIYTGSDDDFALNEGVKRYAADARAAAYVARWYTPSGKLLRPLLALHDTGDPLVPASGANEYALLAQRAGHADNFVQLRVNREGHCVFTADEIGHAFDELVDWVHAGKRPAPGGLH